MSEVLNEKVTGSDGFSRRRVVAGVAWSLPVIATAIAAPAAAASGISATATLVAPASAIMLASSSTGQGTSREGTGPTGFQITNAGAAITGPITGTVNIKPSGTVTAGAGIQSMAPAVLTAPAYTAAFEYNATFTYGGSIPSGQTADFPVLFQYQRISPAPTKTTFTYTLTITLRLPDGTDRILTGVLTVAY